MRIRPSDASESGRLTAVHEQTARVAYAHIFGAQPFPRQEAAERWRTFSGQIWVAEDQGRVIGFVAFDGTQLYALYVLPDCQGRGIGTGLLEMAAGVSWLWVLKENEAARRFYEARGWQPDGTERLAYGVTEMRYCRQTPGRECTV